MARVFISHSSRDKEPAERIKAWLNEQGFEAPFLDFDKDGGIPPGADWEKTLYREIERSEAVIIIQTPNWLESKWCFAEFTQARALGKPIFPIIEAPTGDTLISPDIQTLDLRSDRAGGLERLSRELMQIAFDAQGGFDWDAQRSPYPGLLAFQEEDAAVYFGRDDDIRRLIERLNARRAQGGAKLIALLGASGSGKSSLLRAGVIPRLKRARRNWIVLPPMRPQARPVDELAQCLAIACGANADWRKLRKDLNGQDVAQILSNIARDLRVKTAANEAQILLPIDQGEELFGVADPNEGQRFFEILNATLSDDQPFLAIMALRSDYLGELQSAEPLKARFEEFSLGPMPLARIAQIIEGPARVVGLSVDDAFVQQAVRDAETADALPLLAFALRELYDRASEGHYLSLAAYNALGDAEAKLTPLENSVRKAADDVLAEAKPGDEELTALRDAFVPAMVRVNDQGEYVRRPARWHDLPSKSHPLLERLAKARLLIVNQQGPDRMVEVAHEALLRKWPRLRAWLDEAREFLAGKQQLEVDLRDWERAIKADKPDALLAGLKLHRAQGWLLARPQQLSEKERAYIQASIDQAERRRRIITWGSIAAAAVLACVAVFAGLQWRAAVEAGAEAVEAGAEARDQRDHAVQAESVAEKAKVEAQASADQAKANFREAQIVQSRLLADLAGRKRAAQGDAGVAVLLALEALPDAAVTARPYVPEVELQLDGALRDLHESLVLGHSDQVSSAAFSPDGKRIVAAFANMAQVWDAATGQPIGEPFRGHNSVVWSAAYSADGKRIVTASGDKTARIWDAETGRPVGEPLRGHDRGVRRAAFSPDGKRIATASEDGTARLWDAATGRPIGGPLRGHEAQVWSAAFSPDGKRIVTASFDETARLWDAATGKQIGEPLRGRAGMVWSAAFSLDGKRIVTASYDKTARIWDASTGQQIGEPLRGHDGEVLTAAFSPDGRLIVTASVDKSARIWDAATGQQIGTLGGHNGEVASAAFSPDGKRIVTASDDKTARLWNAAKGQTISERLTGHDGEVTRAAFSLDGKRIVTSSADKTARLWDAATGRPIGEPLRSHEDWVLSATFSPDCMRIVTASRDRTARIWDAATGQPIGGPLRGHEDWVLSATFSPDGTRIVTASRDRTARIWDAATGRPIGGPLRGHEDIVSSAAFGPDGKRIVTASFDETARLWDAATGKQIGEPLRGHEGWVWGATFSPDGTRIVTASYDKTARIWDASTGQQIGEPLRGHEGPVTSAAFSPDGKRIVTASWDEKVLLWDAATRQPTAELTGHKGNVNSAAFSPDGKRIVTASTDKTARLWEIFANTQVLESHAKAAIPRCITIVQRKAFYLPPEPPPWCIEMEKWPYNTPEWKQWLSDARAGKNPPLPATP